MKKLVLMIGVLAMSVTSAQAMNKAELIDALVSKSSLNKAQATRAVNLMLAEIKTAVARGERVMLPEFGTFAPQDGPNNTKGALFTPANDFGEAMKVRPSIKRRATN